ncbi:MAG TPA: 4Fe-4S dicluster domain-containing protein [Polyangiaceae bacterium]|jgi:molybdopterin-containing oxidoreductase family iron-sulfur binding subunit
MSKRQPYPQEPARPGDKPVWITLGEKRSAKAPDASAELVTPIKSSDVIPTSRLSRRGFLGLGAASAAIASEGCIRRQVEHIYPYAKAPEYVIPGVPNHYATILTRHDEYVGALVESHEGHPTKIEGNQDHPTSLGSADAMMQAATMDLYDADRSATVREKNGKGSDWAAFDKAFDAILKTLAADGGGKLRVLMRPSNSPTIIRLREAAVDKFPHARFHFYAPVSQGNVYAGGKIAFGTPVMPRYNYAFAKTIVSLDADFLGTEQGALHATKGFARGRRIERPSDPMSRLWVVEPTLTVTGANADERFRLAAGDVDAFARALAGELASRGVDIGPVKDAIGDAKAPEGTDAFVKALADDLVANKGKSAVVAGRRQPPHVHALVHALNTALENVGRTASYAPVSDLVPFDLGADLKALADDIDGGKVDVLLVLGGNPVYDAPGDIKLGEKFDKVPTSIHLSSHFDETSEHCTWHLPMTHELEQWGDGRAYDGTWSIQQPLIAPLHGGRSAIEILARLGEEPAKAYDLVRTTFRERAMTPAHFEAAWKTALRLGLDSGSNSIQFEAHATLPDVAAALQKAPLPKPIGPQNLEIAIAPDNKLHDGMSANNPWLLELPDPLTKIVWDNAALFSPATAKALDIEDNDVVSLSRDGAQTIEVAAFVMPGQADNSIGLVLGWGRQNSGRYGNGRGFDVSPLRTVKDMDIMSGAKLAKSGRTYKLVQTQEHGRMEGRPLALDTTVEEFKSNPHFVLFPSDEKEIAETGPVKRELERPGSPTPKTGPLWDRIKYEAHKWGMTIDLSTCTGCNACVVACIAENNIAFVGKEQVYRGREMHWLRIDRYFVGEEENNPDIAFQPVACVQCEDAPCENVCPVNATTHSEEGLNDMAYNRCIGTRYCANNCPYKVRRFNFLEWRSPEGARQPVLDTYQDIPETEKMAFNPDVTVRMRGVMEKCTYCVQRIEEAKIAARREQRGMGPNEIKTACQQTCPADAIVFGDLNEPRSEVSRLARSERGYALLAVLGTHPRTTHLGKIRNPSPALHKAKEPK